MHCNQECKSSLRKAYFLRKCGICPLRIRHNRRETDSAHSRSNFEDSSGRRPRRRRGRACHRGRAGPRRCAVVPVRGQLGRHAPGGPRAALPREPVADSAGAFRARGVRSPRPVGPPSSPRDPALRSAFAHGVRTVVRARLRGGRIPRPVDRREPRVGRGRSRLAGAHGRRVEQLAAAPPEPPRQLARRGSGSRARRPPLRRKRRHRLGAAVRTALSALATGR